MSLSFFPPGLGAIFFSIPHYRTDAYKPQPDFPKPALNMIGLCRTSQFPCINESVESKHLALFVIGQIMIGLGLAPLYCLVPTYIDEIIRPTRMPFAILAWYINLSIGPVTGLGAGSMFLQFYVDIDQVTE